LVGAPNSTVRRGADRASATATRNTSITVNQASVPDSDTGTVSQFLAWFANRIRAITGKADWKTEPAVNLEDLAAHQARHQTGGADPLTGNLDAVAKVGIRKDSSGSVYQRRRLNLIQGSNVTLSIADNAVDEEVDVTISAAAGVSGSGSTDRAAYWSSSTTLDSNFAVNLNSTSAEVDIGTNGKVGLQVLQIGAYNAAAFYKDNAGGAPNVQITSQNATDGFAALAVKHQGSGNVLDLYSEKHGVALAAGGTGSTTTTVVPLARYDLESTGTPGVGFGMSVVYRLQSSTTAHRDAAEIAVDWATATDGSRKARVTHSVYDTSKRTYMAAEASGTAVKIGLYGVTPVARAASITKPTTPGATYSQTVATEMKTAIDTLIDAVKGIGITQ